ncbi:MAG: lipase family protein [Alphaproteobacteria bacterium]
MIKTRFFVSTALVGAMLSAPVFSAVNRQDQFAGFDMRSPVHHFNGAVDLGKDLEVSSKSVTPRYNVEVKDQVKSKANLARTHESFVTDGKPSKEFKTKESVYNRSNDAVYHATKGNNDLHQRALDDLAAQGFKYVGSFSGAEGQYFQHLAKAGHFFIHNEDDGTVEVLISTHGTAGGVGWENNFKNDLILPKSILPMLKEQFHFCLKDMLLAEARKSYVLTSDALKECRNDYERRAMARRMDDKALSKIQEYANANFTAAKLRQKNAAQMRDMLGNFRHFLQGLAKSHRLEAEMIDDMMRSFDSQITALEMANDFMSKITDERFFNIKVSSGFLLKAITMMPDILQNLDNVKAHLKGKGVDWNSQVKVTSTGHSQAGAYASFIPAILKAMGMLPSSTNSTRIYGISPAPMGDEAYVDFFSEMPAVYRCHAGDITPNASLPEWAIDLLRVVPGVGSVLANKVAAERLYNKPKGLWLVDKGDSVKVKASKAGFRVAKVTDLFGTFIKKVAATGKSLVDIKSIMEEVTVKLANQKKIAEAKSDEAQKEGFVARVKATLNKAVTYCKSVLGRAFSFLISPLTGLIDGIAALAKQELAAHPHYGPNYSDEMLKNNFTGMDDTYGTDEHFESKVVNVQSEAEWDQLVKNGQEYMSK